MGEDRPIRLVRTDLPVNQRKPIQDAIALLYKRSGCAAAKDKKGKNASRGSFAKSLKLSLDDSFGPHWHVLVGEKLGFACKKRTHTMGVWKVDDTMVVLWQSPGIEEPESSPENDAGAPTEPGNSAEEASPSAAASAAPAVRVLEPAELEDGSETAAVAAMVSERIAASGDEDTQAFAQDLRRRLTARFGTIWHVVVGSDFVVEAAEGRRNHVLATTGRLRVVCFQHEQFKGGSSIDWEKLFRSLPYGVLAVLCFVFMTMGAVCKEEHPDPHSPFRAMLHRNLCSSRAEQHMQYVGGGILVFFFMGRRTYKAGKAAQAKATANKLKVS